MTKLSLSGDSLRTWHVRTDESATCSIATMNMNDLIPSNVKYDWDQETTVTLTECEWLDIKCFLINARESETNELLIRKNRELRSKIDNQLRHGIAQ